MKYTEKTRYIPQYRYSSTNQHGSSYREAPSKRVNVLCLSADVDDSVDLRNLILLGNGLNVPVRYDFDSSPQKAFIEILSNEAV